MAKIVYGLSGEGSGHSSRSRVMIKHLIKQGHTVKVATYGKGYNNLKDEFDVLKIEGLKFVIEDNRISTHKTISENFLTISKRYESSLVLKKKLFKEFQPDCVITDFEPMTAYFANQYAIPLITIDNQHRMRYLKIDIPSEMTADALLTENFIRIMIPRPDVSLITSFYDGELKNKRSFVFPPILDETVLQLNATEENFILVYLTAGFDSLLDILKEYKRENFVVFGYNKEEKVGNLTFKKADRKIFLNYLSRSKAVMATAGFTLITEALYLHKPYCAFPLKSQYEQFFNGYLLENLGYGVSIRNLNKTSISAFLYELPDIKEKINNFKREDNNRIFKKLDELLSNECELLKEFNEKRKSIFTP